MSVYANNEYIISSNNSMNDNKYNSQKAAKSHRIKSILKPLMKMLRRNSSDKKNKFYPEHNTYEEQYCTECEDNSANEELESNIIDEINHCKPNSAIFVCDEGKWDVTPVSQEKAFVPVHFARTTAGTFFWTSISTSADSDVFSSRHCYTECQDAAEQIPIVYSQDRWVQA